MRLPSVLFKKSMLVSLLGHMAVFGIFSFSFGRKIPLADYTRVSFLGQLLPYFQVKPPEVVFNNKFWLTKKNINSLFERNPNTPAPEKLNGAFPYSYNYYLKPAIALPFNTEKDPYVAKTLVSTPPLPNREQAVILHPRLPYSFTLYFRDRQVAHVELLFRRVSSGPRNTILVKRKISSGNLEVDLLSMRSISHYLFIQQENFAPDHWQAVKIDLSAKEQ